jgi:hypothetical protein
MGRPAVVAARTYILEADNAKLFQDPRPMSEARPLVKHMFGPSEVHPLRDGGISWVFYFRKSEVPRRELEIASYAKRAKFLRLAVTFGSPDPDFREYRSTTAVHLWQMSSLPTKISWRKVFVHVFTHEPLHHAISRSLAEMDETGDQEWVISKLGDGRWW